MSRLDTLERAVNWFDTGRFHNELARRIAWQTESDGGQISQQLRAALKVGEALVRRTHAPGGAIQQAHI